MSADFFDRAGQPISMVDWSNKLDVWDYRRVALDDLPNGKRVSTVWLGARPGLFETMTFPGLRIQRYETEAEALAGHRAMVEDESHG